MDYGYPDFWVSLPRRQNPGPVIQGIPSDDQLNEITDEIRQLQRWMVAHLIEEITPRMRPTRTYGELEWAPSGGSYVNMECRIQGTMLAVRGFAREPSASYRPGRIYLLGRYSSGRPFFIDELHVEDLIECWRVVRLLVAWSAPATDSIVTI